MNGGLGALPPPKRIRRGPPPASVALAGLRSSLRSLALRAGAQPGLVVASEGRARTALGTLPPSVVNSLGGAGAGGLDSALGACKALSSRDGGDHNALMTDQQPNNPLHGVTLQNLVEELVSHYGFEELGKRVKIRAFTSDPSIKSALTFLRRTPWARAEVEALYLRLLRSRQLREQ